MQRSRTITSEGTPRFTLAELKSFVDDCTESRVPDGTVVNMSSSTYQMQDPGNTSGDKLSVTWEC